MKRVGIGGFLLRLVAALVVVFGTYNPGGWSFYHWALAERRITPLLALAGIVLLIGWAFFLRATWSSLGPFGTLLAAAFFGTLLWLIVDWGHLQPRTPAGVVYLALVALAGVLAAGISWSFVKRSVAGQVDVDEHQAN